MIIQIINKFITNYLFCSRSKVDFIIRNGKDLDNGYLSEIGMNLNPNFDTIYITGKELKNLKMLLRLIHIDRKENQLIIYKEPILLIFHLAILKSLNGNL